LAPTLQYLILFSDDLVEIRNTGSGRLRQVIAGQNIRCFDDVQMAMANPDLEYRELVLELRLEKPEGAEA
jgi:hypothetical protein